MKRKSKNPKPAWQTVPMASIITLIEGWDRLKNLREEIKDQPEALAHLEQLSKKQTHYQGILRGSIDEIIPNARAHVSAWLGRQKGTRSGYPIVQAAAEISLVMRLVLLWECWLAVEAQAGPEEKGKWLSEISRDERLLIERLNKRITPSIA